MGAPKRYTDEELRAHKNARSKQRYLENKEAIKARGKEIRDQCMKNPEFRKKAAAKAAEWRKKNPEKASAAQARFRSANKEWWNARSREYFSKNPEKRVIYQQNRRAKTRIGGGKLSKDLRSKLMQKQGHKCAACAASLTVVKPHLDHIMPLALGGRHEDRNMQLLCWLCNQQKRSKHPVKFMQEKGFLL